MVYNKKLPLQVFMSETLHCRVQLTKGIKITLQGYPSMRRSLSENMRLAVSKPTFSVPHELKQKRKLITQFEDTRGERWCVSELSR